MYRAKLPEIYRYSKDVIRIDFGAESIYNLKIVPERPLGRRYFLFRRTAPTPANESFDVWQ